MVALSCILACLGIFADARTTWIALREGSTERNPVRRFLIRVLGLNGGTYGVAVVVSAAIVAVNLFSNEPDWSLALGNGIISTVYWWAYYKNSEAI